MSQTISVAPRERWAARSMVVRHWMAKGKFKPKDPICEIEVDGVLRVIHDYRLHPEDVGAIYHYFVQEGCEVGPWGRLLEFSDSTGGGKGGLHPSARQKLVRRDRYPQIFVSYRRDDGDAYAARLFESLTRTFGEDDVFMDEFSIRTGEVWPWTIQQAVVYAKVVIAIIGPKWLTITDEGGKPRIDNPRDYVRRELGAALDRGTPVLPVLLPGGTIPTAADFRNWDDELMVLPDVQFHRIAGPRYWQADMELLIGAVKEYLEQP